MNQPGIFQTVLICNFMYPNADTNWLVSTFSIPERYLAFCMGTHARLGAHSRVLGCLDDVIKIIALCFKKDWILIKHMDV